MGVQHGSARLVNVLEITTKKKKWVVNDDDDRHVKRADVAPQSLLSSIHNDPRKKKKVGIRSMPDTTHCFLPSIQEDITMFSLDALAF